MRSIEHGQIGNVGQLEPKGSTTEITEANGVTVFQKDFRVLRPFFRVLRGSVFSQMKFMARAPAVEQEGLK
jgi:hypothetical protein